MVSSCPRPVEGRRVTPAARSPCSATFSAWWRNASSERSENCATTIAVDVAATTANAIPSHQRTPMKGRGMARIVGFAACRKAIRSIAPPRGCRCSSGRGRGRDAASARRGEATRRATRRHGRSSESRRRGRTSTSVRGRPRPPQPSADERAAGASSRAAPSVRGTPWLVLRGDEYEAVLWNGPCSSWTTASAGLVPDIVDEPPDSSVSRGSVRPTRAAGRRRAARPAARRRDREHLEGRGAVGGARLAVAAARERRRRRARARCSSGAPADAGVVDGPRRCAASTGAPAALVLAAARVIRSAPQGEHARTAYWCPGCQVGGGAAPPS